MNERKKILPKSVQPVEMGVSKKHDEPLPDFGVDLFSEKITLAMDMMRSLGMPEEEILLVSKLYIDAFAMILAKKLE